MFFNSRQLQALSNDQLRMKAPAIFAEQPKSTTSDNYLFVPTIKLIDGMRSNGWQVVAAKQTMNRSSSIENKETNKHALFFARSENLQKGAYFNESLPLVKMINSHNGESSYGLASGFFRIICANGLTVPDSIYSAPKVKHVRDMASEVIDATYKVLKDFPLLVAMQQQLSQLNLSNEERMLFADAAADIFFTNEERQTMNNIARSTRNDRYLIESQLTQAQRHDDKKNDLWTISNVVQENMIRGNVKTATQNEGSSFDLRSKRKVTSIDKDNDIHTKLFALTQKFAELKGLKIGQAA
jgi:hypothetical protein